MNIYRFGLPHYVLVLALCLAGVPAFAEEAEYKYRVLGLFQDDREEDLVQVVENLADIQLVSVDYQLGEATFRFDAKRVWPGNKNPEQIVQGLDRLVRSESRSTFEITPPTGAVRSELEQVEIAILGLDCKGCSYAAYLAVYKLKGVENATASFREGKLVAWINLEKTNRKELEEALEQKRVTLNNR